MKRCLYFLSKTLMHQSRNRNVTYAWDIYVSKASSALMLGREMLSKPLSCLVSAETELGRQSTSAEDDPSDLISNARLNDQALYSQLA